MTDRYHLWLCAVHCGMQQHAHRFNVGYPHVSTGRVVHLHDVGDPYAIESNAEWVGPGMLRMLRISHGEMTKQPI